MSADTVSPYPGPVDTFIKVNPNASGPFTYEEAVAAATGAKVEEVVVEEAPVEVVEEAPAEEAVEAPKVEEKVKKTSSRRKSVDS